MAEITVSLTPGQYPTGQTLTVTFPPNARRAIITRDDRAPVFSEVLAYDTGPIVPGGPNVERPFIAVTQDGRGNVMYDGGCPKYTNGQIRNANGGVFPTTNPGTVDALYPSQRYLYNAFEFCSNKNKVAKGNRKVLVIGDTFTGEADVVTDSHYNPVPGQAYQGLNGYRDTLDGIAMAGNWDITYYDVPNGSTPVDFTLEYLEGFVSVIFFSIAPLPNMASSRVTDRFCKNLAVYRAAGSGIAIITDHCGNNYTSLADALARGSAFATDAIKIAAEYGCYFSGNVLRAPILVSEIKRQIGLPGPPESHPLLDGLADDSTIYGGPSESIVVPELYTDGIVDHTAPYVVPMNTVGVYRVNVLVQLDDGSVVTRSLRYVIISPGDIQFHDTHGRVVTASLLTYKRTVDYTVVLGPSITGTLLGKMMVDDVLVGYFQTSMNGTRANTLYYPFSGPTTPMPLASGQTLKFVITDPFEYVISTVINRAPDAVYFESSGNVATFATQVKKHPYFAGISGSGILREIADYSDKSFLMASKLGATITNWWWKLVGKGRLPFRASALLPCTMKVYASEADWTANKPVVGSIGDAVIIANNNGVYYWDNLLSVWVKHPQTATTLFGLARQVLDTRTSTKWIIQIFTTVPI